MLFLSDTSVGEEFVYAVQRGDSRTRMGARFCENPVALARENGLGFPSVLNVGITLNIIHRHIVPKSDLIDGICRVHSCTVHPWCMNAPYIRYRQGPRGPMALGHPGPPRANPSSLPFGETAMARGQWGASMLFECNGIKNGSYRSPYRWKCVEKVTPGCELSDLRRYRGKGSWGCVREKCEPGPLMLNES